MTRKTDNHYFMAEALRQAAKAAEAGEVPVGAVIVKEKRIIAADHNRREEHGDATAHAEMLVIRQAGSLLGGWRLPGCTIYVTLEPCPMCAGAMVLARLEKLVYGAPDPKAGAVDSLYNLLGDPRLNHRLQTEGGIMAEESARLLRRFFQERR